MIHLISIVMGTIGIVSGTVGTVIYLRGKKYHWTCMALSVSTSVLEGKSFYWDDLVKLYNRDADGTMPTYDDGRRVFAQAKFIIKQNCGSAGRCFERAIERAERSVPNASQVADLELKMNFVLLALVVAGMSFTVFPARSLPLFIALVFTSVPALMLVCYLVAMSYRFVRLRRITNTNQSYFNSRFSQARD